MKTPLLILLITLIAQFGQAGVGNGDILPPIPPWSGKSRSLMVADNNPWVTPSEQSKLTKTPNYEETMAWLEKLAEAAPELKMTTIGTSLQGREIKMIIASSEQHFTPESRSKKPLLLVHAGIHSGEIDGKDAGMMLLRDMTVLKKRRDLLEKVDLLFIPILSVDGHERSTPYSRINQRGPESMGWRTNARNQNLNRDYVKLETLEVQALLEVINQWQPQLYVDVHVTDGIDAQYDITFGYNAATCHSPAISNWLDNELRPAAEASLKAMDHVPGPLFFAIDNNNLQKGIVDFQPTQRYSNGYGASRHLPTILVENHALKPYDQRVLGTYVFLKSVMETMGKEHGSLREAINQDKQRRPDTVALAWGARMEKPETYSFLGITYETFKSSIADGDVVRWTGKPETMEIPMVRLDRPTVTVSRPKGYWVPATWPEIIEKLKRHGVEMETLIVSREVDVEMYRIRDAKPASSPFEGRFRVTGKPEPEQRKEWFPKGSVYVSTNQPLCELIVSMLEPTGPDSFFQWGYFHEILQRTEYFEGYVGEPLAQQMLKEDSDLQAAFQKALAEDEKLAGNPRARLHWFYERSPYMDERWLLYPIARVNETH